MNFPIKLIPLLIRIFKLEHFKYRILTIGEIALCKTVFGDLIDYEQVKITNQPYLPWQSAHVLMAPSGYIQTRDATYSNDYSKENLSYQAVFIHEMTHILQYQKNINVVLKGAILQTAFFLSFKQYNPYKYQFIQGKSFWDYNIEQQGDIARDIFLKRIDNIILNPS